MYLQRIEIQGFKSFAKKTVLAFKRDITAIVGPNGSGKSNVSDAVRWVLGEQSSQLLRTKRGDDVIFAGSESRGRLSMAEVSLYFNNEDKSIDMEYAEIVITRRIFRGAEGEYYINNNRVRLTDIIMLLAQAHVGQKSYSIVGQGMIDQVLKSSAYDRRVFFDEATGVREYQIKRDKTVGKLDLTRENIEQVTMTLGELEPRMKLLSRQVRKLEEREIIENELLDIQTKYYSILWTGLDEQIKETFDRSLAAQNNQDQTKKEISSIEARLKELSLDKTRAGAFDTLQNEYQRLQNEKNQLTQSLGLLQARLEGEYSQRGMGDMGWLERRIQDLKESVRGKEFEHTSLNDRMKQAATAFEELSRSKDQIYAQLADVKQHLAVAEASVAEHLTTPKIKENLNRIKELQARFLDRIRVATQIDELRVLQNDAEQIYDSVQTMYNALDHDSAQEDKKVELRALTEKLNHEKDALTTRFTDARVALEVLQNKVAEAETAMLSVRGDLDRAEMELKTAQIDTSSQGEGLAQLQKERDHLAKKIADVDLEVLTTRKHIDEFNLEEERSREQIFTLQSQLQTLTDSFNTAVGKTNELKVEMARLEQRREDLLREIKQEMGLPEEINSFTPQEIDINDSVEMLKERIQKGKARLQHIGGIDPEVVKEFNEVSERYTFLKTQTDDLSMSMGHLETIIRELDVIIEKKFNANFRRINENFSQYFRQLFSGGRAQLKLVEIEEKVEEVANSEGVVADSEEIEETATERPVEKESKLARMGIEIVATPPGKKIENISVLSGGEKTMTSIALICAIIATNPPPFVILDEVDAALDEANSDRFAGIIQQLSSHTQFICITHNRAVMHSASSLYGVTMGNDGTSQLLSLALKEAEAMSDKE